MDSVTPTNLDHIELKAKPYHSIIAVKRAVARRFKISLDEIEGPDRKHKFSHPRQIAMAMAYRRGFSLSQIGRQFGNRHYSTILFAAKKWGHIPDAQLSTRGRAAREARARKESGLGACSLN